MLDIRGQGSIDATTINFFFKDIRSMLLAEKIHPPSATDVIFEIFDMVPTKEYGCITLKELIDSQMGGTVVGLLIDKDCFLAYEFREQQIANSLSS